MQQFFFVQPCTSLITIGYVQHAPCPATIFCSGCSTRACFRASPARPHNGRRIGEATQLGDDVRQRCHRALQGLHRPDVAPASDAETLSDTLSQRTPFASPRELECETSPILGVEPAPAEPGDASGFTPSSSPTSLPALPNTPLCWQDLSRVGKCVAEGTCCPAYFPLPPR